MEMTLIGIPEVIMMTMKTGILFIKAILRNKCCIYYVLAT